MSKVTIQELSDLANEVLEAQWNLTHFEALQIAVQIQRNKILSEWLHPEIGINFDVEKAALNSIFGE